MLFRKHFSLFFYVQAIISILTLNIMSANIIFLFAKVAGMVWLGTIFIFCQAGLLVMLAVLLEAVQEG